MSLIRRAVTATLTSPGLRSARRAPHRLRRTLAGRGRVAEFFLQIDDPYAALALPYLTALADRYCIDIAVQLVSPPDAAAAPEPKRLSAYALRDANAVATALGLPLLHNPEPDAVARAQRIAAAALAADAPISIYAAIVLALHNPSSAGLDALAATIGEASIAEASALIATGNALRERLGHYLGATTHFEGEFYWGVDRLHFLERRLRDETGIGGAAICPILDPAIPRRLRHPQDRHGSISTFPSARPIRWSPPNELARWRSPTALS